MPYNNHVVRSYSTGCADCEYANKMFDRFIANSDESYDGQFVCCGDDLCREIIPSTYDASDKNVDEDLVMHIDNDSAGDLDNDSAGDLDNDSAGDLDNDTPKDIDSKSAKEIKNSFGVGVQSTTADINRSKTTNRTVDENDKSSSISTSSWLIIVVIVIIIIIIIIIIIFFIHTRSRLLHCSQGK